MGQGASDQQKWEEHHPTTDDMTGQVCECPYEYEIRVGSQVLVGNLNWTGEAIGHHTGHPCSASTVVLSL